MKTLEKFGVQIPYLLFPATADIPTWSVIACDQYTQDRSYWQQTAATAGSRPSTLSLILPEVYLNDTDKNERITSIRNTMHNYLASDVFAPEQQEAIYIERTTAYGRVRHGLMLAVDLDQYEWQPESKTLIRATEATVPERIPPRMEIRRGAPLETPHIMLLINDPEDKLIGKTGAAVKEEQNTIRYDGDLMMKSGHITGWCVRSPAAYTILEEALTALYKSQTSPEGDTFLFAVGDGNHSLATAKAVWEEYKVTQKQNGISEEELKNHPARYALVEIVNLYDTGLTFEPIHRVVFNAEPDMLIAYIQARLGGNLTLYPDEPTLNTAVAQRHTEGARFGFIYTGEDKKIRYEMLSTAVTDLAVSRFQPALDDFMSLQNSFADEPEKKISVDYIHGAEDVCKLGEKQGAIGVLLPPIEKESFFSTIGTRGPLPRKSFSMGEASEKRFYLECRKLF
jgi:uncharacterized protein (DUF1015 family)